jgi:MazG family protein
MDEAGKLFQELADIVAKLRDPEKGCPWDLKQTHASIKDCCIEEAYEVIDAIDAGPEKLKEELGDLLLQVVLHSQIAADQKDFTVKEVIRGITEKLIKRHPHVFADVTVKDAAEVTSNWEKIKRTERSPEQSMLDGIPRSLPSLMKAERMGERTARVGFDCLAAPETKEQTLQALADFQKKLEHPGTDSEALAEEFGEILFALAQIARKMHWQAEILLDKACAKFAARFQKLEQLAGSKLNELSSKELQALWAQVSKD